jgi:hypothetical protein
MDRENFGIFFWGGFLWFWGLDFFWDCDINI